MTRQELIERKREYIKANLRYSMRFWKGYNYARLKMCILTISKGHRSLDNSQYNDVIIGADTETSKSHPNAVIPQKDGSIKYIPVDNYVVAWTISIRAYGVNIVTLYGTVPSDFCRCLELIHTSMNGEKTIIYFHNFPYDYVFLRKFMSKKWGTPKEQLNVKPHFPLFIEFENGLIFKDSYMLAQRSLDKWAKDMDVEHKKAVGKWDYLKIRHQNETFNADELQYIEQDTLALVECIDKQMELLGKSLIKLPLTATGIPREQCRIRGEEHDAHSHFLSQSLEYEEQEIMENVFHGGFTHANRHLVDHTITGLVKCFDFNSSYPYCMLSEKMPADKFMRLPDATIDFILKHKDKYAFIFKIILVRPVLKDREFPMPALQHSKAVQCINPILDNGRILGCDYIEIYLNEIDLTVINEQYEWKKAYIVDCEFCIKDYLPRWFTDYVFQLYIDKTQLKGIDDKKVEYALKKGILNSCYGMCVQKPCKPIIEEDYDTGEFVTKEETKEEMREAYKKYREKRGSILCFQWGTWVTSAAFRNLFELGKCCGTWVYSDTDSIYGMDWNYEAIEAYNENCKRKLKLNGYGAVVRDNVEYWLGTAVSEGTKDEYTEFRVQGAKRYCGRNVADGELHITVAGVPKKGAVCLKNNISSFTKGMVFDGKTTGKNTHAYIFKDDIETNSYGDLVGDSIDLTPCDYLLDGVEETLNWEDLLSEETYIQVYEDIGDLT